MTIQALTKLLIDHGATGILAIFIIWYYTSNKARLAEKDMLIKELRDELKGLYEKLLAKINGK